MGVTIGAQLLLVPVYLRNWTSSEFGAWLAVQALFAMLILMDSAVQSYIHAVVLQGGEEARPRIRRAMWSAIAALFVFNTCLFGLFVIAIHVSPASTLERFIDAGFGADLNNELSILVVFYSLMWLCMGTVFGTCVRVLGALGQFARLAWWGVFISMVTSVAPAVAALYGANVFEAAFVWILATWLVNIPFAFDLVRLLRVYDLRPCKIDLREGGTIFFRSQLITAKSLLEFVRQQGVRLVLAPMTGTTALANFSTLRTGANLANQGMISVMQPLLPDLMRFIRGKEEAKAHVSITMVWFIITCLIAPFVMFVQFAGPSLYEAWTLGKMEFNPLLFALFSLTVLLFSIAQPAIAIVQSYNRNVEQLWIMSATVAVLLVFLFVLVPRFGLNGAGVALLLAEIILYTLYRRLAKNQFVRLHLNWPESMEWLALQGVLSTALILLLFVILPALSLLWLPTGLLVVLLAGRRMWAAADPLFRQRTLAFRPVVRVLNFFEKSKT